MSNITPRPHWTGANLQEVCHCGTPVADHVKFAQQLELKSGVTAAHKPKPRRAKLLPVVLDYVDDPDELNGQQ